MNDQAVRQDTRANRDLFARVLTRDIDGVVAPLLRLDEHTRASIVALVGAAQLITASERAFQPQPDALGDDFDAILYGLHPDGAALLAGMRTTGLAESVAFGWTLSLRHGEQDNDGTTRASRAAAAEVACALNHLDALLEMVKRLHLPAHVASDQAAAYAAGLCDFPAGWEPACRDM